MTYWAARKWATEHADFLKTYNGGLIKGFDYPYKGLVIAPSASPLDLKLEIAERCLEKGMDNQFLLFSKQAIDSDLTVFVVGKQESDYVIQTLQQYLTLIEESEE